MNSLLSKEYETLPIEGAEGARMPGYTGHVPGAKFASVYGQRKAVATKHEHDLRPLINATGGAWQDMQMMDLRPEMRSYNKVSLDPRLFAMLETSLTLPSTYRNTSMPRTFLQSMEPPTHSSSLPLKSSLTTAACKISTALQKGSARKV